MSHASPERLHDLSRYLVETPASVPVHLGDNLLPRALATWNTFSPDEKEAYERLMGGIKRLGTPIEEGFPVPPGYEESNLQHVYEMNDIVLEFFDRYPTLSEHMDPSEVQLLILVHDLGELAIGDLPAFGRTEYQKRLKEHEGVLGERMVISKINGAVPRQVASEYFGRYMKKDPNDPEVLMAASIDKIQGFSRRSGQFLDLSAAQDPAIKRKMISHAQIMSGKMAEPITGLREVLHKRGAYEAVHAVTTIYNGELANVARYGYPQLAERRLRSVRNTSA